MRTPHPGTWDPEPETAIPRIQDPETLGTQDPGTKDLRLKTLKPITQLS